MICSNQWRAAALLCVFVFKIAPAADQPAQALTVTNSMLGVLAVVSHRMQPTGTGAVIGGLVGAALQFASNKRFNSLGWQRQYCLGARTCAPSAAAACHGQRGS